MSKPPNVKLLEIVSLLTLDGILSFVYFNPSPSYVQLIPSFVYMSFMSKCAICATLSVLSSRSSSSYIVPREDLFRNSRFILILEKEVSFDFRVGLGETLFDLFSAIAWWSVCIRPRNSMAAYGLADLY